MKRFFLFLCFLSVGVFAQERVSKDLDFDLIHTELHVKPIWESMTLEGKAILSLSPYFYPQSQLVLNAKDFALKSIKKDGKDLKYTYDGRFITISLDKTYKTGELLKVEVEYVANPEKIELQPGEENQSERGLYFINVNGERKGMPTQLWTQCETQSCSAWFPTLDYPNQNHTQDIFITVKKNLTTLSNGLLVESKDLENGFKTEHWKQKVPHAVYLTMMAVGDFVKVVDKDFNRFEVSYYMEPAYAPYAKGIFGRTPEMITYFEDILGVKYPWEKYSQVPIRRFVSGAMENTTATTHARSVLKNSHQLVDGHDDAVIAHELFHHWFGNYVTCESWSQLPLNEAFANYSEYLWAAHKYGKDEGDYTNMEDLQSYLGEAQSKQVPLIRFDYLSSEDMFDAHSYQKGGRILHTLRSEVGDEAFFKTLKYYLEKYALQSVEVENLRMAFEKITGRDLKWFFDQWFHRGGHPTVGIVHKIEGNKLVLSANQLLDSLNTQAFRIKLPIKIYTSAGVKDTLVRLDSQVNEFSLSFEGTFKHFVPNSDGYFLGVVSDKRTVDDYIAQYRDSEDIFARFMGLETALILSGEDEPMKDAKLRDLIFEATKDKFWRIRQLAVQRFFDYDGDDFLKVEKRLEEIIKTDPASNVRADAILSVKNFLNPSHIDLARTALKDTSYAVQAAALEYLFQQNVPDADSLALAYENVQDGAIFGAVLNYYVQNQVSGKMDWILERMGTLEGMEIYQYLGLLGSYIIVFDDTELLNALPFLRDVALNEFTWYARMSGVRVLYSIKHLSASAQEVFDEAIKKEKDSRLIGYYKELNVER